MFDEKFATTYDELIAVDGRETRLVFESADEYQKYREKIELTKQLIHKFKLHPLFRKESDIQRFSEVFALHDLNFDDFNCEVYYRKHHYGAEKSLNEYGLSYLLIPIPPSTIYITFNPNKLRVNSSLEIIEGYIIYLVKNAFLKSIENGWRVKVAVTEEFGDEEKVIVAHAYWLDEESIAGAERVAREELRYVLNGYYNFNNILTVTDEDRAGFEEVLVAVRKSHPVL